MRVAVVTPYWKESTEVLERNHKSVMAQTHCDLVHYMIQDGNPFNSVGVLAGWDITHVQLPHCGDYGDTPRLVGCALADAAGVDAIVLLDADCWLEPEHVANMVKSMQETGAAIVTCPRSLWRMDGTEMGVDSESNGIHFNDTNCYLVSREAFYLFRQWGLKDRKLCIVDDRVFWKAVQESGLKITRNPTATVNYPTSFAFHYEVAGEKVPDGAKVIVGSGSDYKMVSYPEFLTMRDSA